MRFIMRGNKIQCNQSWEFTNKDDPIKFIKMLCDSYDPSEDIRGYGTPKEGNISAVKGHYGGTKDIKLKKKLANGIVQLMRDEDYRVIAIPAAAELYLEEALPEFKFLSTLPLEQLRAIKTVNCTNALFCTINYSERFLSEFRNFLLYILKDSKDSHEINHILSSITFVEPEYILKDLEKYIQQSLEYDKREEIDKITGLGLILSGIFKKCGDGYCINLAKRFKEKLPKEYQVLFYKALEQNPTPRFKPYLEELKKILEIGE